MRAWSARFIVAGIAAGLGLGCPSLLMEPLHAAYDARMYAGLAPAGDRVITGSLVDDEQRLSRIRVTSKSWVLAHPVNAHSAEYVSRAVIGGYENLSLDDRCMPFTRRGNIDEQGNVLIEGLSRGCYFVWTVLGRDEDRTAYIGSVCVGETGPSTVRLLPVCEDGAGGSG